jgi:hypothetical protein
MIGSRMQKRKRWVAGAVLAALLCVGVAAALASSSADSGGSQLPPALVGPRMARAEVVVVIGGVVHDFRVDQGLLAANRPAGLLLHERDGTIQLVPVSPAARVTLNGAPSTLAALRRGLRVLTVRDGDTPAYIVRARTLLR